MRGMFDDALHQLHRDLFVNPLFWNLAGKAINDSIYNDMSFRALEPIDLYLLNICPRVNNLRLELLGTREAR